jgi:hypothetical protein
MQKLFIDETSLTICFTIISLLIQKLLLCLSLFFVVETVSFAWLIMLLIVESGAKHHKPTLMLP